MMSLLEFKLKIQNLYQKYSIYIEPIFKFIVAIIVFQMINNNIGYDERLKSIPIVLALSLICAFTPSAVMVLFAIIMSSLHVFYVSPILSIVLLVVLVIMYFLYLHFTPELSFVLLAIPILSIFNMHYIIPILLGLFFTPLSIVASACGIIIIYLFKVIIEVVNMQFGNTIEDILQIYTYVIDGLVNNLEMFLTITIFSLIILFTYIMRRLKVDYAHEVAVGVGAITCILGFLIGDLRLDVSEQIGMMIVGTLFSGIIALAVQFFYRILDYSRTEHVQFEDDDYYYYVKAVPKIEVSEQKINIKRINPQRRRTNKNQEDVYYDEIEEDFHEEEIDDEYYDDFYDDIDDNEEDLFFDDIDK